jgi:DNA-binding GntR family transcriptional regulator
MKRSTQTNGSGPRGNVQELVEAIRAQIVEGELVPGRRVTEESLSAAFGVSRIPVREALRVLASEGFVQTGYYGRTTIATLDTDAAHDLLDVRAVLEPLAAAQAATRCTQEHLEKFHRLLDEADRAFCEHRYNDTRAIKVQFYEHLAVASQNASLISLMRILRYKIEWATSTEAIQATADEVRNSRAKLLHQIVDAIADRDPARAATAAAANIDAAYASQHWRRVVDVRFEAASADQSRPNPGDEIPNTPP